MAVLSQNQFDNYSEIFSKLENEIRTSFEALLSSISERREFLLTELNNFKIKFVKSKEKRLKDIRELESMKEKLDVMDVEDDQVSHRLKGKLQTITEELEELRKRIPIPNHNFQCDIKPVIEIIEGLGEIKVDGEEGIYYEVMHTGQDDKPVQIPERPPTLPPKPQRLSFRPKISYEALPQDPYVTIPAEVPENKPLIPPRRKSSGSTSQYEIPREPDAFREFSDQNLVEPTFHALFDSNPFKASASPAKQTHPTTPFEGKKKPSLTFCKRGTEKGQMVQPRGIFFAPITQSIYVVSRDQHKVLVFTLKGKFVTEFGNDQLEGPSSVTVHYGKCYVTDEKINGIFTFRTSDFEVEGSHIFQRGQRFGKIKSLKSIMIDSNNEIYLVDTNNDQICVLNYDMTMNRTIGFGVLQKPQDINVSMERIVYVLDLQASSCVHTFTKKGEHLDSIINTDILGQEISSIPNYFCVSKEGLIILSILYESTLKVYSSDGTMIQEIGKKQSAKERLSNCQGICLANDNRIVCAFGEGNFCINIY